MDPAQVAAALAEIGRRLRVAGDNPYRARAYERGARAVGGLDDLAERVRAHTLTEVPGIGPALAATVEELVRTGRSHQLDRMRQASPEPALELTEVLTPKQARDVHAALGIATMEQLEDAASSGALAGVKGFGDASAERVRAEITRRAKAEGRLLLVDADDVAEEVAGALRQRLPRAEVAGGIRRRMEVVDRVVLVAEGDAETVAEALRDAPGVGRVRTTGGTVTGRLARGIPVDVIPAPTAMYARALFAASASPAHLAAVLDRLGGVLPDVRTESAIYREAGLPLLPPELREDPTDIEAAARGDLPGELVNLDDLRGVVHCHSTWSDGHASIEEMARAADALGLAYLTITDHSPSAFYAGGVTLDRLPAQWEEIARVQEHVKVRLLRGTESDILADGALDYPDPVLEQFDVIIASIHNRHRLDRKKMTDRIVHAMELPVFKIWGHPLGRLLLKRDPVDVDVERILDVVARAPAAVEINGDPHRLDLEPRWLRAARERGIPFVISADAHSTGNLGYLAWGVGQARRAGVQRDEVLNTRSVAQFLDAVRPVGAQHDRRQTPALPRTAARRKLRPT